MRTIEEVKVDIDRVKAEIIGLEDQLNALGSTQQIEISLKSNVDLIIKEFKASIQDAKNTYDSSVRNLNYQIKIKRAEFYEFQMEAMKILFEQSDIPVEIREAEEVIL